MGPGALRILFFSQILHDTVDSIAIVHWTKVFWIDILLCENKKAKEPKCFFYFFLYFIKRQSL